MTTIQSVPQDQNNWGGSQSAIQFHYDVGNDFYELWLGGQPTYSCALWSSETDDSSLAEAQTRKLDWHIAQARAEGADRVLDIGCGWGTMLERLVTAHGVKHATGLTLSAEQAKLVRAKGLPQLEVREESWTAHQPTSPYDAIISVGAFEHFASPADPVATRRAVYRDFFERTARWLKPDGRLSLQTIAYGTLRAEDASEFMKTQIFPDAELPRLEDIIESARDIFEVEVVRNDRRDYAKTCEIWARNLRQRRAEAVALVGEPTVARYQQYLKLSSVGFAMGKLQLLRIGFRRERQAWKSRATNSENPVARAPVGT